MFVGCFYKSGTTVIQAWHVSRDELHAKLDACISCEPLQQTCKLIAENLKANLCSEQPQSTINVFSLNQALKVNLECAVGNMRAMFSPCLPTSGEGAG